MKIALVSPYDYPYPGGVVKHIFYLDINEAFLDENGVLTREVMPDLLHPHEKGYKIWAEAMEPTIKKLMDE